MRNAIILVEIYQWKLVLMLSSRRSLRRIPPPSFQMNSLVKEWTIALTYSAANVQDGAEKGNEKKFPNLPPSAGPCRPVRRFSFIHAALYYLKWDDLNLHSNAPGCRHFAYSRGLISQPTYCIIPGSRIQYIQARNLVFDSIDRQ